MHLVRRPFALAFSLPTRGSGHRPGSLRMGLVPSLPSWWRVPVPPLAPTVEEPQVARGQPRSRSWVEEIRESGAIALIGPERQVSGGGVCPASVPAGALDNRLVVMVVWRAARACTVRAGGLSSGPARLSIGLRQAGSRRRARTIWSGSISGALRRRPDQPAGDVRGRPNSGVAGLTYRTFRVRIGQRRGPPRRGRRQGRPPRERRPFCRSPPNARQGGVVASGVVPVGALGDGRFRR